MDSGQDGPPGVSRRKAGGILAAVTAGLAALYGGAGRSASQAGETMARNFVETSVDTVKKITWDSITIKDFASGWRLDKALEEKWGINPGQEGVSAARQINGKLAEVAGDVYHIPARPPRELNLPGELVGIRVGQDLPELGGKLQKVDSNEQKLVVTKQDGQPGVIDLKKDPGGVEFTRDPQGNRSVVAKIDKDIVIMYKEGPNYHPQVSFKPDSTTPQNR